MMFIEFVQSLLLVVCIMASGVVLPVGLVAIDASLADKAQPAASGPVFVFEEMR